MTWRREANLAGFGFFLGGGREEKQNENEKSSQSKAGIFLDTLRGPSKTFYKRLKISARLAIKYTDKNVQNVSDVNLPSSSERVRV